MGASSNVTWAVGGASSPCLCSLLTPTLAATSLDTIMKIGSFVPFCSVAFVAAEKPTIWLLKVSWWKCDQESKIGGGLLCELGTSMMDRASLHLQVLYLTFEWLWKLARETFAPVWSLSKVFMSTNLVIEPLPKIRLENIQNRRPHGSLIKHGGFWDFWMCRSSMDEQSPDIPFRIRWILGNSIRHSVETTISRF